MEATIKETVKNIFKTHTFEEAVALTEGCRGEYIHEFGVKSWNALVTYYKHANVSPEPMTVAEPEAEYPVTEDEATNAEATDTAETDIAEEVETDNEMTADETSDDSESEVETVEYMLYRNTGANVEWFGHRENFKGLQVGETARMIRMNNNGVSEGIVVASNKLTLDDVALFHRCYGVIIRMKRTTYKEQLGLAARCLMNLPEAIGRQYHRVPANDVKLTEYILNYGD